MNKTAIIVLGLALTGAQANAMEEDTGSNNRSPDFAGNFYAGITLGRDKTNFDFDLGRLSDKSASYGLVLGRNFMLTRHIFFGLEGAIDFSGNSTTVPAITTFPVGFSTATIKKSRSLGLVMRTGVLVSGIAVYGVFGATNSKFKYLVDDMPIAEFLDRGNSSLTTWGTSAGVGIEAPLPFFSARIRGEYRRTKYTEVSAENLGLADSDLGLMDLNSRHIASRLALGLIVPF